MRDAELDRYRALDAERSKWEGREERTLQQLETARRELDKISTDRHGAGSEMYISMATVGEKLKTMEEQLQGANEQMESQKSVIVQLQDERYAAGLENNELRAELAHLEAKLRRKEHLGRTDMGGNRSTSLPLTSVGVVPAEYVTLPLYAWMPLYSHQLQDCQPHNHHLGIPSRLLGAEWLVVYLLLPVEL